MIDAPRIADQREREEALDPARSFIVEAPAGSGKTGLLTQRYLRLLSVVERPEAVVAMTFTRKAAAEMKERVLKALAMADEPENEYELRAHELAQAVLQQDRRQGWNLLADTSRLQVQTIDSLCATLTRRMPLVSQFGGFGEVIEDAFEMYAAAARRTLRGLAEGDAAAQGLFRRVALHFDNDLSLIESQIARMLEHRDQWWFLGSAPVSGRTEDFRQLLERARTELDRVFRERRAVDFAEITRAAIQALGTPDHPTDLLYWLDYRIEHLLVDEFQDTSRAQYKLIEALTREWSEDDNRSLFLVGDPMQSIYRFREAEVSLFLRCWESGQLGSVRLTPLRLKTNFRSSPEIVAWTGQTFAPIMNEDDPARGGIKLRPAEAARTETRIAPQLIPLLDDDGRQEAREIIRLIKRTPEDRTIAILVRNRAHIAPILPALREAEIPYEAVEIERLGEQQHILDLLSLTRALLHLGDRTAWLACLRAPWCGLALKDLSALAESEPERTIFDLLSDPARIQALSAEGRSRAIRAQEILAKAVSSAGRVPLRGLVERTWTALGGPSALETRSQREDAETFFGLLESAGTIYDPGRLESQMERLYAQPRTAGARVQVMTIHKAKGLEFDTVIVPKLERGSGSPDRDLLIWTEVLDGSGESYLAMAAQPRRGEKDDLYKQVSDEIKQKDAHELKRLFYVAATRAKSELYLLANAERKKRGAGCKKPREGTLLRLIWDRVENEFDRARQRHLPVQQDLFGGGEQTPRTVLRRLPASWRLPAVEHSVRWEPELVRAAASARKVTYEWVGNTGRHAGTLTHELLQRIAREGATSWSEERIASLKPLLESDLRRAGVAHADCKAAADRVAHAVANTLASERGRWILAPHEEAQSEWAVSGRVGGKLIDGTVDRVFRDEQGRWWIVDFKTSAHEGGRVERFLKEQERRYRLQLENYAALLARMHAGPIWLGLYFPLLDAWREWRFEEAARPAHYTV